MRIFDGRYFLFAAALMAVWLLGKSRSSQPVADASWASVSPENVDQVFSVENVELAGACLQESACTEDIHSPADRFDDAFIQSQTALERELDGRDLPQEIEFVESAGEESIESIMAVEPLDGPNSSQPFAEPDRVESVTKLADVKATQLPLSETEGRNGGVINNKYSAEGVTLSENESSGAWQKNPFVGAPIEVSTEARELDRSMPASFERNPNSVLDESHPAMQVTIPEPDFSSIEYGREDIAPQAGALPDGIAQKAVHHIEYGKSLSRRGATFGARQEFFGALSVIARGNDSQAGGNAHTTALNRAIRALREVHDFVVKNADTRVGLNVSEVLETHQTRIISANEAAVISPVEAMQRYLTFAHQQLEFAGGRNVVVAEALFCLGKLHTVMATRQPGGLDVAKAIVFHKAASASDSQNYRSFNELGVLMARNGDLDEAEKLFKKSLRIQPVSKTWENLAKTHDRKGEAGLAQLAQTEFSVAAQADWVRSPSTQITWLPQQAFNQVGPADFQDATVSTADGSSNVVPVSRTAALADDKDDETEKKSFAQRFNLKKWF
jgi:tetratricopeptide (TPR) repeat protein